MASKPATRPPWPPPLAELSEDDATSLIDGSDGLGLVKFFEGFGRRVGACENRLGLLQAWLVDEKRERVLEAIRVEIQKLTAEVN